MNYPSKEAIDEFKQVIKDYVWTTWSEVDNNAEMKKMYASDRKDFRKVLSLYKKGKWEEALESASHMDTAARDHIPEAIWDHITNQEYEY